MSRRPVLILLIGILAITMNDSVIKSLSDAFPLHEIVLARSLVALLILLPVAFWREGLSTLSSARPGLQIVRGLLIVCSNMTFFLGLAAIPLAEATALVFISPLLITAFSALMLGEQVGPRRWIAVLVGLGGVVVMTRPFDLAFDPTYLLPLAAAVFYAGFQITTRQIGQTDGAFTMAIYVQVMFTLVSLAIGLALGDGRAYGGSDPSLAFLLRAWALPDLPQFGLFALSGLLIGIVSYCMSEAYRSAEASLLAPLEYMMLPMALVWGFLFFGEWPDLTAGLGMLLIVASGLFVAWRELGLSRRVRGPAPGNPSV